MSDMATREGEQIEKGQDSPVSTRSTSPSAISITTLNPLLSNKSTSQHDTSTFFYNLVIVHFRAIGSAPSLRQSKFKVGREHHVWYLVQFLQAQLQGGKDKAITAATVQHSQTKTLFLSPPDHRRRSFSSSNEGVNISDELLATSGRLIPGLSLFLYLGNTFGPAMDEQLGDLFDLFATSGVLVISYSLTPAYG